MNPFQSVNSPHFWFVRFPDLSSLFPFPPFGLWVLRFITTNQPLLPWRFCLLTLDMRRFFQGYMSTEPPNFPPPPPFWMNFAIFFLFCLDSPPFPSIFYHPSNSMRSKEQWPWSPFNWILSEIVSFNLPGVSIGFTKKLTNQTFSPADLDMTSPHNLELMQHTLVVAHNAPNFTSSLLSLLWNMQGGPSAPHPVCFGGEAYTTQIANVFVGPFGFDTYTHRFSP